MDWAPVLCCWWGWNGEKDGLKAGRSSWPPQDIADNQDTYRKVFNSMFKGRANDTERDLAKLLTPDFYLRSAGTRFEYPEFVSIVRRLRAAEIRYSIAPVMFLRDGPNLAVHAVRRIRLPNGNIFQDETWQFVVLHSDGRIAELVVAKETCFSQQNWEAHMLRMLEEIGVGMNHG